MRGSCAVEEVPVVVGVVGVGGLGVWVLVFCIIIE